MLLKKFFKPAESIKPPVKRIFFVLSTGRSGTRYLSNLFNVASNATILHQPQPGCEKINPIAYELFLENRELYHNIKVEDFTLLHKHAEIFRTITNPIYGDCYNSIYPFGIALYNYFQNLEIDIKFIHLVRNPVTCASSILRAEGRFGIGERQNFKIRAQKLFTLAIPAEIASEIWIGINQNIQHQMAYIEKKSPDSTRRVKLEDIQRQENISYIHELFRWLGLSIPDESKLLEMMSSEKDEIRHSHQKRLDGLGIPNITDKEIAIIINKTQSFAKDFGY
jgi:hypothetical protein